MSFLTLRINDFTNRSKNSFDNKHFKSTFNNVKHKFNYKCNSLIKQIEDKCIFYNSSNSTYQNIKTQPSFSNTLNSYNKSKYNFNNSNLTKCSVLKDLISKTKRDFLTGKNINSNIKSIINCNSNVYSRNNTNDSTRSLLSQKCIKNCNSFSAKINSICLLKSNKNSFNENIKKDYKALFNNKNISRNQSNLNSIYNNSILDKIKSTLHQHSFLKNYSYFLNRSLKVPLKSTESISLKKKKIQNKNIIKLKEYIKTDL